MNTPWGRISIADAHVHFFSHHFFSMLAKQKGADRAEDLGPLLGWEIPGPDPVDLAKRWVSELDRHDIARATLIASMPGDEDSVAVAVRAFPGRFSGYFLLDPRADHGVDRARKALGQGLRGVCFFPAMHSYSMHDPAVQAVLSAAAEHAGTEIFVHCGVLTVGVRRKLGLASPFDLRYSNPIDLHAIALRYPQLRFIVPHFGAGYFREVLMLCDLCPNVCLDTSSSNTWMKYEGLDLKTVFRRALDVAGAARLRFGSDSSFFPRGWNAAVLAQQIEVLCEIGISASDARAIFGEN